jgi:serine/threonine protein kinase
MERAQTCGAQVFREAGPLPVELVASWGVQALCGLSAVHARHIVHRDLKPANLLLGQDDRVMLADFGIAQVPGFLLDSPRAVVGSPSYMAPEQIRGGRVGPRADLYALGCTLFVLATGEPAQERADDALRARLGALQPVLELAMRPEPGERYATARAMARDLASSVPDSLWTSQPHLASWLGVPSLSLAA